MDIRLTPTNCAKTPENLTGTYNTPKRKKLNYLQEHQQGLEVLEVPWGPALEQKIRGLLYILYQWPPRCHPSPSQKPGQKTRRYSVGRGPTGAAPSHFPLFTKPSILIYRHHLDREVGLVFSWTGAMFTKV